MSLNTSRNNCGHSASSMTPRVASMVPDAEHAEDERLADVLSAQRADLNRFSGEIGAGGVELLPDQGVVAGRDEERELVIGVRPGDLDRPVLAPVSVNSSASAKYDPIKKFAAGFLRSMMPSTAAV